MGVGGVVGRKEEETKMEAAETKPSQRKANLSAVAKQ